MEIKIITDPSKPDIDEFDKFSDANWGEQVHEVDSHVDFFDLPRIVFELMENDVIVSGLVVLMKSVFIGSQIFHVAGVGGVVTHKDHRHKGYATQVLRSCHDFLRKSGIKVAMLCTEIDRLGVLYEGVGYKAMLKPYYFLDKNNVEKEESGGMICFLDKSVEELVWLDKNTRIFVGRSNF